MAGNLQLARTPIQIGEESQSTPAVTWAEAAFFELPLCPSAERLGSILAISSGVGGGTEGHGAALIHQVELIKGGGDETGAFFGLAHEPLNIIHGQAEAFVRRPTFPWQIPDSAKKATEASPQHLFALCHTKPVCPGGVAHEAGQHSRKKRMDFRSEPDLKAK